MAGTNVLILMGSPRQDGNSAVLAKHLAEGASESGAHVDIIYVHGLGISPCTGCNACQMAGADGCVIDDDMKDIYAGLRTADSIVFASPVYWFSITAQLKTVIDRMYAVGGGDKNILACKKFGILLVYADSDPFRSGAVNALRMFQDISSYLGTSITGAVYGSAYEPGEIAENKVLLKEAYNLGEKLVQGD